LPYSELVPQQSNKALVLSLRLLIWNSIVRLYLD
jgi:hypothetical protein